MDTVLKLKEGKVLCLCDKGENVVATHTILDKVRPIQKKAPFKNDTFPNPVFWDIKTVIKQNAEGKLALVTERTSGTFMCSGWHGFTATVVYGTGLQNQLRSSSKCTCHQHEGLKKF